MGDWIRTLSAFATAAVAIYVAFIGTMQWKTAQEKLRLDLYNRRFDIYVRAIDFANMVTSWKSDTEASHRLYDVFMAANRESRFLFDKKSRVYELMEELRLCYEEVRWYTERESESLSLQISRTDYNECRHNRHKSVMRTRTLIPELANQMEPYLNFHQIQASSIFDGLTDSAD